MRHKSRYASCEVCKLVFQVALLQLLTVTLFDFLQHIVYFCLIITLGTYLRLVIWHCYSPTSLISYSGHFKTSSRNSNLPLETLLIMRHSISCNYNVYTNVSIVFACLNLLLLVTTDFIEDERFLISTFGCC